MNVKAANAEALRRLIAAEPVLIDCVPASEALGLEPQTVLHAGPPIGWEAMCPPVQGAVTGAMRYEGWAPSETAAIDLAARGGLRFEPCHHRGAVGPMAGIITCSMPVFVIENRAFGNRAYATINEGLGRVLRYGANDESVLARLAWLRDEVGPLLGRALRRKSLDLRPIMAQALRMGDEMHQRNIAASSLLARALFPSLAREANGPALTRFVDFLGDHDQFFLNLAMAAAKAALDPLVGIAGATVVTTMARNGTEFGIRVAGCGARWFTAPVNMPKGLYFPGFGPEDSNPDMGDSAIVETVGLGGMAMAASPAVARFVGAGGLAEALRITEEMREITLGEHPHFRIPTQDDRGAPVGIDVRRVVATGITPLINTGIAGRKSGVGQVGAGFVRAPLGCFTAALEALAADPD